MLVVDALAPYYFIQYQAHFKITEVDDDASLVGAAALQIRHELRRSHVLFTALSFFSQDPY